MMKRNCENCKHYMKLKNKEYGICWLVDGRVDKPFKCVEWKGIKYSRNNHHTTERR